MKKLFTLIIITGVICFHLILSHVAEATCWVSSNTTNTTDYSGLPGLIYAINFNDEELANCQFDADGGGDWSYNPDDYEFDEMYLYAFKYLTEDFCDTYSSYCSGYGFTGMPGGDGLYEIDLAEALSFSFGSQHLLIGNPGEYDDFGLPLLNTSAYTTVGETGEIESNVFECSTFGGKKVGLRNTIFQTGTSSSQGPSGEQVMAHSESSCVIEEYDVYWCGGEVFANPEDIGGSQDNKIGWCREDYDRDGSPNDDDCDDEDPGVQEPSDEIPGNSVDEDCDGILGDCEITLTPNSDSVYPGESTSFTLNYTTQDYDGSATLTITGEDSTMTVSGDLELESGDSSVITVGTSADTPAGVYVLTVSAETIYSDGAPVSLNNVVGKYFPSNSVTTFGTPVLDQSSQVTTDAFYSWKKASQGSYICGELTFTLTVLEQEEEICGDGLDNDGDGAIDEEPCEEPCTDADGDGSCVEDDCDDNNPEAYPGAEEVCDDVDNDCDGSVDEGLDCDDYDPDADGDGYCDDLDGDGVCDGNESAEPGDCDDSNASINPGATEICDGVDNDCDGKIDDVDADGDGYYECSTDCDDTDPNVNPGAEEICANGVDDDCDGTVDDMPTWYMDKDGDSYGDEDSSGYEACEAPNDDYVSNDLDCDDEDEEINPAAFEICDGLDNDCDGEADDGLLNCAVGPGDPDWDANLEGGAASGCSLGQGVAQGRFDVLWCFLLFLFVPILSSYIPRKTVTSQ